MRPHLSIYVKNIDESVNFYKKVFGIAPQKLTHDYAKFDLKSPALNFSMMSSGNELSKVAHLGIEVDSEAEVLVWKSKLELSGIFTRDEMNTDCCYATQDKIWFSDPNGNDWEIFYVKKQLDIPQNNIKTTCNPKTGCCP